MGKAALVLADVGSAEKAQTSRFAPCVPPGRHRRFRPNRRHGSNPHYRNLVVRLRSSYVFITGRRPRRIPAISRFSADENFIGHLPANPYLFFSSRAVREFFK